MKNVIFFLSLIIWSNIFSQVIIKDCKLETKNVFYAKANDLNKDSAYLQVNEIIIKKYLDNKFSFTIDNNSRPTELTINSKFKIKLKKIENYYFDSFYIPFILYNNDSFVVFKTEYDFRIEVEYIKDTIQSIHIIFDTKNNDKIYNVSKEWYNSLTLDDKLILGDNLTDYEILNSWIEQMFLGLKLNENFIKNETFSFKYTNTLHCTNIKIED